MKQAERRLRQAIIEQCLWMNESGLNQGTSGNISARFEDRMLITPSGVPYGKLAPGDIAAVALAGKAGDWSGPLAPSSEWRFHFDILRARSDVGAVVHTHSTYATALAMTGREIPAAHYMIATRASDARQRDPQLRTRRGWPARSRAGDLGSARSPRVKRRRR